MIEIQIRLFVFLECLTWVDTYMVLNFVYCFLFMPTFSCWYGDSSWWRHQMETLSALLAICAGNSPVPGESPAQRPVTRSFDVFFDLCLNKRLREQSWGWLFETLSHAFWRHCNVLRHEAAVIRTTIMGRRSILSCNTGHTYMSDWLHGFWMNMFSNSWQPYHWYTLYHSLMQERRNSIVNALELRLSCTNPSIHVFCLITCSQTALVYPMKCTLFFSLCFIGLHYQLVWINMIYLPISYKVASLVLGQSNEWKWSILDITLTS